MTYHMICDGFEKRWVANVLFYSEIVYSKDHWTDKWTLYGIPSTNGKIDEGYCTTL